jgi:hypothetical protein
MDKMAVASEPSARPALLLGCGILAKEVAWLAKKNAWPVDIELLSPSLHIHLRQLASELNAALARNRERKIILFYGMCHPWLERMVQPYQVSQVDGQNCIEMLLGAEHYQAELGNGAFFLLEEWANSWDSAIRDTFGPDPILAREIFTTSHQYLLGLRTPCSADFAEQAQHAGRSVALPVRWLDSRLEHLESALEAKICEAA